MRETACFTPNPLRLRKLPRQLYTSRAMTEVRHAPGCLFSFVATFHPVAPEGCEGHRKHSLRVPSFTYWPWELPVVSPRQPEVCRGLVPAVVAKHLCKSLLTCPLSKTPHPADFQRRVKPTEAYVPEGISAGANTCHNSLGPKPLGGGIFWIQERFYESGNRANIWLVRGSQRDVVVDAGLGLRSLPDYLRAAGLLEGAGGRPLLAVATHVHFDHAGGLRHFEEVAVHSAEAAALLRGDNYEAVTWLWDREVARPPRPGWRARQFRVPPVRPSRLLQDGDVISLGDRQLTVMHMPGHSRGSICLHDREHKILFSGDVVYDGSMIDWLPYSRVSDYVASCQRLMELVDRGLVEKVLPGHFNIFGAERLYRLASNYISQAGFCHKVSTCAMRSIASIALRVTNSRGTSS